MHGRPKKGRSAAVVGPETVALAEIVPEAQALAWVGVRPGEVSEIPLDASPIAPPLDLRLGARAAAQARRRDDVAAAQAVSLPSSAPARRGVGKIDPALRGEIANLPLFADLEPESLHELIGRLRVVVLDQGQILFRQGDAANALYVVVEGAVVPIAEGAEGEGRRKLAVIERGDFVGEIGLMTKQPRNATVAALVESTLVAIDRSVLVPLMRDAPSVAQGILRFLRSRMLDRQIRSNLFFAAFAHAEREAVARQFRLLEVKDGTRIVTGGQPPEGLFVVLAGSLARVDPARGKQLGRLELGDVFGGDWLLAGKPSPWDVVARGRAWMIVLGERRFRRIVETNPRLVRVLERLARRGVRPGPTRGASLGGAPNARASTRSSPARAVKPASSPRPPSSRAASADRARRSRS
jgi:CRP/FNR family cyclic AMP-dependent transcriptional regulator